MQRKFEYQETQKIKKSETVELPVYSKHDLDSVVIYHKLFARTDHGYVLQTIQTNDNGETSFSEGVTVGHDLGSDANYYLGKGEFASSKAEWEKALSQAKTTLSFYEP